MRGHDALRARALPSGVPPMSIVSPDIAWVERVMVVGAFGQAIEWPARG